MASAEIQIVNPALLSKIESFLNDPSYKEAIENSATYNTRLCVERRMRMPFLDSQTGVAQNHSNLFMSARQRLPGLMQGQIYSYPSKRWRKKRRQYLMTFMQPRRKEVDPESDLHTISTVENPAALNEDSKDSMHLKDETAKDAWYYDELDMQDMEGYDEPDADSDYDYEDSYSKRKRRRGGKMSRGGGRGRKKATPSYDILTDAEKPFACELCGARYKTRPGLTYHYTHSHKDRDDEEDDSSSANNSSSLASSSGGGVSGSGGGGGGGALAAAVASPPKTLRGESPAAPATTPSGGLNMSGGLVAPGGSSGGGIIGGNAAIGGGLLNTAVSGAAGSSSSGEPGGLAMSGWNLSPQAHHHPPPYHYQQYPHQQQLQGVRESVCLPRAAAAAAPATPASAGNTRRGRQPASSQQPPAQQTPTLAQLVGGEDPERKKQQQQAGPSSGSPSGGPQMPNITESAEMDRAKPSPYCDFCLGDERENKKTGTSEDLVSCSDCGRSGHPSCLQFTANMIISVRKYRWQCIECKCCSLCGNSDNDDQLLFCDDCDRGYHMYCLTPPLTSPPEGSWSCVLCLDEFHKK